MTRDGSGGGISNHLRELDPLPHAANMYADAAPCCPDVLLDQELGEVHRRRLEEHLARSAPSRLILIGEAAGWRGARQTGVAFTAPRQVHGVGMAEGSATVVRAALESHCLTVPPRLFNAFPLHPHRPDRPRSNRAPTAAELRATASILELVVEDRLVVAVGRAAASSWERISGLAVPAVLAADRSATAVAVRHPSFGGAEAFRRELGVALRRFGFG